jgi:hypothetical protein
VADVKKIPENACLRKEIAMSKRDSTYVSASAWLFLSVAAPWFPVPAFGHGDGMDGPVVKAAKKRGRQEM